MKAFTRAVKSALPVLSIDALGVAGSVTLVYGIWQIHQPAAFIVAGLLAIVVSILAARR